jgi:hypothetical protein
LNSFEDSRNNDPDRFERTKSAIGDIYDTMARAIGSGTAHQPFTGRRVEQTKADRVTGAI